MGVWSQGGWAGDTPFEGRAGLCGQGEKAFRALPTCMAAQPLTAGLGGVGGSTHGAQGSYSPLPHSLAALLCRGETEAQRGHLHPDCRTRNPGSKKAVCLDSEELLKDVA